MNPNRRIFSKPKEHPSAPGRPGLRAGAVRSRLRPFATVRVRLGRAYGEFCNSGHFGGFRRRVAGFRVGGVALCVHSTFYNYYYYYYNYNYNNYYYYYYYYNYNYNHNHNHNHNHHNHHHNHHHHHYYYYYYYYYYSYYMIMMIIIIILIVIIVIIVIIVKIIILVVSSFLAWISIWFLAFALRNSCFSFSFQLRICRYNATNSLVPSC